MRQLSVNQQGVIIPILPLLGIAVLAIGIAVSLSVVQNPQSQDNRTRAAENAITEDDTTVESCLTPTQRVTRVFGVPCPKKLETVITTLSPKLLRTATPMPTSTVKSSPQSRFSDYLLR